MPDNLDLIRSGEFKAVCIKIGDEGGDGGENGDDSQGGITFINQQLTQIMTWIQNFQAHEHLHWSSWSSCVYKQTDGQCVATKTRQKTYDDGYAGDAEAEQQTEMCETPFIGWSEWKCAENVRILQYDSFPYDMNSKNV